jgi:hypothetical protein
VSYRHIVSIRPSGEKSEGNSHLVLFKPFLEKLLPALLQNWASKLHGLEMIKLPLFQKNAEVLKDR